MAENIRYVRWVAAIAVLVSAYVHYKLWVDGMKDIDVVGPAFLLNAVAGVVIAVLLVAWQHWIPGFLTLGFGRVHARRLHHLDPSVGLLRRARAVGRWLRVGSGRSPR